METRREREMSRSRSRDRNRDREEEEEDEHVKLVDHESIDSADSVVDESATVESSNAEPDTGVTLYVTSLSFKVFNDSQLF